jgi:hypothetical protein
MNPDEFEQALQRDLASASRHDPTPAWKAEILARASAPAKGKVITFPRLVLLAWAACWAAALVLHFMTPGDGTSHLMARSTDHPSSPADNEWRTFKTRREAMSALLAANDSNNLVRP